MHVFLTSNKNTVHMTMECLQDTECKSKPPTCDVIHYNSCSRVSDVTWDQATKSLLPCRVPQLQPDLWGKMEKGNGGEIKHNKRKKNNNTEGMKIKQEKTQVRDEVSYGDKKSKLKEN